MLPCLMDSVPHICCCEHSCYMLDGYMLVLQSIHFLDKSYVQPLALGNEITIINKEVFADVFAKKNILGLRLLL